MGLTEDLVDVSLQAIDAPAAAWERFDAKARRDESIYKVAARLRFTRERADVVARIIDAVPAVKAQDPVDPHPSVANPYIEAALLKIAADYAPGGEYHRAWLERYRALIGQTMRVGGRETANQIGLSFTLDNPRARQAVLRRVTKLTGSVTQTTVERIRKVVTDAMAEGVGVTEIARRVREDAFGDTITRSRAQTIAQTESVGALNEGRHLGATTGGVMQSKRWLDQDDGRVRESHQAAAAVGWIGIDERFPNGLLYPHEPGAPAAEVIQCRCGAGYSDLPASEANARQR
jgi:uncharacterized protein YoaH (UPF0181 family)